MPLSRMKPVRCETSGGRKASPQVVWWLRHGASNSTRSKERNGEVGGSYIKPSLLYLSLKHCRPNTNYGKGVGGGWLGGAQGIFRAAKLCCIPSQWTHVTIPLSRPTECIAPRVNPNVNCECWVMMMCQCRCISSSKYPALVGDVDGRAGNVSRGSRDRGTWERNHCSAGLILLGT